MTAPKTYRANTKDTTSERLDGETIIINLSTGRYYSLSGPAADVYLLGCSGAPIEYWWGHLESAYLSPPVREDVDGFISQLVEAQLIQVDPSPAKVLPANLPDDFVRGGWTVPRLEEFEDLQDLILVDPIHDTTNLGWPYVEGDAD
jgi:hypothetical protein